LAPQYIIEWDKEREEGGSVPDFVALDYCAKEIVVIEVTASAGMSAMIRKVRERQMRWYAPIARNPRLIHAAQPGWKIRFPGFIRKQAIGDIEPKFIDAADVTFAPLQCYIHSWEYSDGRVHGDLPGKGRNITLASILGGQSSPEIS
jgi:hypothetical protein